jgi:hypothetical protein
MAKTQELNEGRGIHKRDDGCRLSLEAGHDCIAAAKIEDGFISRMK